MTLPPVPRDPARALWLSSLGLLEDPFDSAPDPRFLHLSSQHGPILDRLHSLIGRRRGLAIVDGGPGLGKTILARRLESYYRARHGEYEVAAIDRPGFDSEYTAYLALSAELDLKPKKGVESQWHQLQSYVAGQTKVGRGVLFILDSAETLNSQALTGLDHVAHELAPVFLFGRERIQLSLAELPEVLARAERMTLASLPLREAVGLVRYRCRVAGREDDLFSADALEFMWEAARGVPADLVELCNLAIADLRSRQGRFADLEVARAASDSYAAFSPLEAEMAIPKSTEGSS